MYVNMYIFIRTHIHTTSICARICICIYAYIYMNVCVCVWCVCVFKYIYLHLYIHSYVYIHIDEYVYIILNIYFSHDSFPQRYSAITCQPSNQLNFFLLLSGWQIVEFSKERGFVITSVEDVVCYRSENFEVPSFFESTKKGT